MPRIERVDGEICKVLNEAIARELKDPRVDTLISVTSVETAKDLKTAKVYVSIMDKEKAKDALKALNNASGFLRGILFERLKIRIAPHLDFALDNSFENGDKIDRIIYEIHKKEEEKKDKTDE
jgi:ribosome-binding factor A